MAADPELSFLICRASFLAARDIQFAPPAANLFRGALGMALPGGIFRPTASSGPSGLRDRPRPFVLRTTHLDGAQVRAGQRFEITLHVFSQDASPYRVALSRLRFAVLDDFSAAARSLSLAPLGREVSAVRVEFLTPTELKPPAPRGELPPFQGLLARLRDRISALSSFYAPREVQDARPPAFDYTAFAARAAVVQATAGCLDWVSTTRTSSRTGQTHPLSGFTGWVEYRGPLAEFLPWLEAGYYTGVGRQTVWGKGVIRPAVTEPRA